MEESSEEFYSEYDDCDESVEEEDSVSESPSSAIRFRKNMNMKMLASNFVRDIQEKRGRTDFQGLEQPTAEVRSYVKKAMATKYLKPDAVWRWAWDALLLFGSGYYAVLCPLSFVRAASSLHGAWIGIEILFNVIFVADIVLNFFTCFDQHERLVDDKQKIRWHYATTYFAMDLISALPMDLLGLWLESDVLLKLGYVLRLLRLLHVNSLFAVTYPALMDAHYVNVHFNIVPSIKILFWVVVATNAVSVGWIAVQEAPEDYSFLLAIYFVLYTMTTVGYGDVVVSNDKQRFYALGLFLFGVTFNALVIAKVSSLLARSDLDTERKLRMKETLSVMQYYQVPKRLQEEVFAFMHHSLQHSTGSNVSDVLDHLPDNMKERIGLYIKIKFIQMVPMFQSATSECKMALATALENVVAAPQDKIIEAGQDGQEMFFLGHGIAEVIAPNGYHIVCIPKGGFFGEIALLIETKRTASIKALTYCDLFKLSKNAFRAVLDQYPEFKGTIQDEIQKKLADTQKRQMLVEAEQEVVGKAPEGITNVDTSSTQSSVSARGAPSSPRLVARATSKGILKSSPLARSTTGKDLWLKVKSKQKYIATQLNTVEQISNASSSSTASLSEMASTKLKGSIQVMDFNSGQGKHTQHLPPLGSDGNSTNTATRPYHSSSSDTDEETQPHHKSDNEMVIQAEVDQLQQAAAALATRPSSAAATSAVGGAWIGRRKSVSILGFMNGGNTNHSNGGIAEVPLKQPSSHHKPSSGTKDYEATSTLKTKRHSLAPGDFRLFGRPTSAQRPTVIEVIKSNNTVINNNNNKTNFKESNRVPSGAAAAGGTRPPLGKRVRAKSALALNRGGVPCATTTPLQHTLQGFPTSADWEDAPQLAALTTKVETVDKRLSALVVEQQESWLGMTQHMERIESMLSKILELQETNDTSSESSKGATAVQKNQPTTVISDILFHAPSSHTQSSLADAAPLSESI